MASYSYSMSEVVESPQGDLSIGRIISAEQGHIKFEVVPSSVFFFPSIEAMKAQGLVYYAIDYPNYLEHRFPKLLEIGTIKGMSLYCAIYVDSVNIPSGIPITDLIIEVTKLVLFLGDKNGEVTPDNLGGYRYASFQSFYFFDTSETYTAPSWDDEYDRVVERKIRQENYGFFATFNNSNQIIFFQAPQHTEERIDISVYPPLVYVINRTMAMYGELNSYDNYDSTGEFPITDFEGHAITTDDAEKKPQTSDVGGGSGSGLYTIHNDVIGIPALPTLGAANSGLLTLYNPTLTQVRNLSDWLWSNDLLANLEKMYAQPLDLIVTFNVVPCEPQNLGVVQNIKIGGVNTHVSAQKINNQYMQINCGQIKVNEFYGSAVDFGKNTKVSIYLPFVNTVSLKTDEVMDGVINVVYNIDLFTGSCVAFVRIIREGLDAVLYSFEGNLAISLPLVSRDFSNMYASIARTVLGAVTGGASVGGAINGVSNVMSMKPDIQRTSGSTATGGLLGAKKPYLIIERPQQSIPADYKTFNGYPSNITAYLSTIKGYTEVETIISNNLTCTDEEQTEIIDLLKTGVYL